MICVVSNAAVAGVTFKIERAFNSTRCGVVGVGKFDHAENVEGVEGSELALKGTEFAIEACVALPNTQPSTEG